MLRTDLYEVIVNFKGDTFGPSNTCSHSAAHAAEEILKHLSLDKGEGVVKVRPLSFKDGQWLTFNFTVEE